ncbi:MAG: hypothetical protein ACUZ8O_10980 [Candidatus Anammoxibacter sp.]
MKSLVKTTRKGKKIRCANDEVTTVSLRAKDGKRKRTCLMCNKLFNSESPYNRRCPGCNRLVSLGRSKDFHGADIYRCSGKEDNFVAEKHPLLWS